MKFKQECPTCNHVEVAYSHKLNKSLVSALRKLVDFYELNQRPCKASELSSVLGLTYNQVSNFQKLKYFDLVKNFKGEWVPTTTGIAFIYGQWFVWNPVTTYKGEVVGMDHPAWPEKTSTVYVSDIDETAYKQKIEYQMEKSNQLTIL